MNYKKLCVYNITCALYITDIKLFLLILNTCIYHLYTISKLVFINSNMVSAWALIREFNKCKLNTCMELILRMCN